MRVEAEDGATAQLRRTMLDDADAEVAVLDRPRKSPSWNGARIAAYWLAGTPPRNTSVSVPRLTPERSVRTRTSPGPGSGSEAGRISPTPGSRSQNASASLRTGLTLPRPRIEPDQRIPVLRHTRVPQPPYNGGTVRAVQRDPAIGLIAQLVLLAALAGTVGLSGSGWVVGIACGVITNAALARGLARYGADRLGPADRVTLTRATLAGGVAALTADSFGRPAAVTTLVALTVVALVLDAVDGWVARRTETASTLGAHFDMEVDAFLILVLSVYVARSAGAVGARDRRGALRVRRGRLAAAVDARAAAAALLAQGRRGDPGRRADVRGRRRSAPLVDHRGAGRRAGLAGRVVRPRRAVAPAVERHRSWSRPGAGQGPAGLSDRVPVDRRRVRTAADRGDHRPGLPARVVRPRRSERDQSSYARRVPTHPARGTPRRRPRSRPAAQGETSCGGASSGWFSAC